MIGKKINRRSEEQLDLLGREIVRASAMNEAEGESAAASPFLYARLRSRINAEREQREAGESWSAMLRHEQSHDPFGLAARLHGDFSYCRSLLSAPDHQIADSLIVENALWRFAVTGISSTRV